MVENSAMTRESIEKEVNRYITLPGQACTYKIGELKILELRKKSENALGDEFDLKEFHKTLLYCPGPLNVLESCVDKWIREQSFTLKSIIGSDHSKIICPCKFCDSERLNL